MALLFLEGFEEYNWSVGAFNNEYATTNPHNGVACVRTDNSWGSPSTSQVRTQQNGLTGKSLVLDDSMLVYSIPSAAAIYIGFAFFPQLYDDNLCGWAQNSTHLWHQSPSTGMRIYVSTTGQLVLINNNTGATIATSTNTMFKNAWYYIEIKYVFGSGTSGACEVRVDNETWINVTGVNTAGTATAINNFYIQASWGKYFDDFYICDSTGTVNNDFLGPINVYTMIPTGNSATVQMTASAGSNFQCVDEIPFNTTDYVTATVVNQLDLYTMSDLPASVSSTTIPGVLIKTISSKPTVNPGRVQLAAAYGGSTSLSSIKNVLSTSYVTNFTILEKQPDGTSDWTVTAVNGMEVGVKAV